MKYSKLLNILMVTTVLVSPAAASHVTKPPVKTGGFFSSLKSTAQDSIAYSVDSLTYMLEGLSLRSSTSSFSLQSLTNSFKSLSLSRLIPQHHVIETPWDKKWDLAFSKLLKINVGNTKDLLDDICAKANEDPAFMQVIQPHLGSLNALRLKLVHAETDQDKIQAVSSLYQSLADLNDQTSNRAQRKLLQGLMTSLLREDFIAAGSLKKAVQLRRSQENLGALQNIVKNYYRTLDGGTLSLLSIDDLEALEIQKPIHQSRWSLPSMKGAFLLGLVATSGLVQVVAATSAPLVRPAILNGLFPLGGSFKEGLSGFMPITFGGTQLDSDVTSILTFSNYQNVAQNGLANPNGRSFALNGVRNILNGQGMPTSCINGDGCYFGINTFANGVTSSSNMTAEMYHFYNPGQGVQFTPYNGTTLNQTSYDIASVGSTGNFTSSLVPGSLAPYYLDQRDGSEIMALFTVNPTGDLVVMSAMERGLDVNGAFYRLIAQRVATDETIQNRLHLNSLPLTPVASIKPTTANTLDGATFDQMNALYSGYVDSPSGNMSRTIQQYATDQGLLPMGLVECLQKLSVDPLLCVNHMDSTHYMRLSTFLAESTYGLKSVSTHVVDGPMVNNSVVRQINGTAIETVEHTYSWNPSLGTPNNTASISHGSTNAIQGNLALNSVEKFVEIYGSDLNSGAVVLHVTQTPTGNTVEFKALPGSDLVETAPPSPASPPTETPTPTPMGPAPTPTEPELIPTESVPTPMAPVPTGLSVAAKAGIGAGSGAVGVGGIIGGAFLIKKMLNKDSGAVNDLEMGTVASDASKPRETQLNFGKSKTGIAKARTLIKSRYQLIDKIDREDAKHIETIAAGVSFVFPEGVDSMPLVLGNGNFGKVGVVYDTDQEQYLAVKFVRGNDKVKASLREGHLQYTLSQKGIAGTLPLLDYLHFDPSESKSAITKLQEDVFGSSVLSMKDGSLRDMAQEELLIQITPWATFGNGETFQGRLNEIEEGKFKQKLINHAAYGLVTSLASLSDFGVSHLDVKPENTLLTWDGDIFLADFGCARIKDKMQGGLGDFRYFSPERLKHVQNDMAARRSGTKVKGNYSGKKSDAWALGMTLLQWSIGEHPFAEALKVFNGQVATGILNTWVDETFFAKALTGALNRIRGNALEVMINGLLHVDADARWTPSIAKAHMEKHELVLNKDEVLLVFEKFRKTLFDVRGETSDEPSYGSVPLFYSAAPVTENYHETHGMTPKADFYLSRADSEEATYAAFYESQQLVYLKEFKHIQAQNATTSSAQGVDDDIVYTDLYSTETANPPRRKSTIVTYTEIGE